MQSTKPPCTRDFLPRDRRRSMSSACQASTALRLRAARDTGVREHRDAPREVRRGGQQAHFQDSQARRARVDRRGRPRASVRPDRPARPGRRAVSERAAEVLQALPDSTRLARGPAGEGPLPRVLSVRYRLDGIELAGGRGGTTVSRQHDGIGGTLFVL